MVNKAKCRNCGDIIESKRRHDFVACSCFAHFLNNGGHGIFIDGGQDYFRAGGNFDDLERIVTEDSTTSCNCNKGECFGSCTYKKGDKNE